MIQPNQHESQQDAVLITTIDPGEKHAEAPKRKRRRRKSAAPQDAPAGQSARPKTKQKKNASNTAQPARAKGNTASIGDGKTAEPQSARQTSAQQPQNDEAMLRHVKKKRLYEIDNSGLPENMPPILPLLNSRPDTAPEKGTSRIAYEQEQERRVKVLAEQDVAAAILVHLRERGAPASNEQLLQALGVAMGPFIASVDSLLAQGKLFTTKKHKLALPEHMGYLSGRVQMTAKGFGFLIPEDASDDVFLPASALLGALHGDRVFVRLADGRGSSRGGQSREGEVVSISERANLRVVGTVEKNNKGYVLIPDNGKLAAQFPIPKGSLMGAKTEQKVVCSINYDNREQPTAKVTEVLGFATDVGTDVLSIIRSHDIPEEFSKAALHAVRSVPEVVPADEIARREDLRSTTIVTIDGADAKDLDDAISLERLTNGNFLLGVHIADVSHYVKEGAPLDHDALKRGTSVYFVDRVIPMLPKELSNGICSLNPDVDRLTLSCFMEIDAQGEVVSHRFAETVIRSKERLTYDAVTAAIEGDAEMRRKYAHIAPMFEQMKELCDILNSRREKRGSIDFDIPEAKIKVDAQGKPVNVSLYPRGISNRMIEEFMLIANETVAAHMSYLDRPMMYRVHETPDAEKITELNTFLGSFGLMLKGAKGTIRPKTLQGVLYKVQGKPEEAIISRVMLRSLKKARYCEQNLGHFGLAAENYCHFTSPIRRYPDLVVHRMVKEHLHGRLTEKRCEVLRANMKNIADQCSERERAAMEAEREVDDLKKCEYMAGFLGEVFDGIVSGVTSFGMFVELPNTCEGLVRMSDLQDDYYQYEEKNYRFVGRHTGKMFRLGDPVTVQVAAADVSTRRVDFVLVEKELSHGKKARGKSKKG